MSTTTTDPAPSWYEHPAVKSVLSCPQRCCACCGNSCTKFKAFIAKGSVVDLAIAVIIGNSFQKIVSTFTDGIITPLIAAATANDGNATQQLSALNFDLNGQSVRVGDFFSAILAFLIVAAICFYAFVLPYMSMMETWFPKKPTRKCPECMQVVDVKAVRCHSCCIPLDPNLPTPKPKPKRSTVTAARDMLARAHKASSGCCVSSACCCCCGGGGNNEQVGEGGNRGSEDTNGNEQQGDNNLASVNPASSPPLSINGQKKDDEEEFRYLV